eukprot:CAMPEP_0185730932 /NCGR_PEP_ID=MMETSP1171-20130828/11441_1 /TAXON_ID=374046 /ORGANISM="Helicotheca tamensis, Strain CCMP826" /LENGTH=300 /DNA_ID=CAMNT_0028400083 /DNA_START=38 /DNA_END=936 /DNA_ORIENTATION=+
MNPPPHQPKPSATTAPPDDHHHHHRSYILIENPKKSNNLGPILRCAAAFAVSRVILIGYEKCSTDGSHGAAKHVPIISFPTFDRGVEYLKKECGVVSIIGLLGCYDEDINIVEEENTVVAGMVQDENLVVAMTKKEVEKRFCTKPCTQQQEYIKSWPIHKRSFAKLGNTSFVISKNWKGLPFDHATHCDSFVHIPLHSAIAANNNSNEHHLQLPEQRMAPFQILDVQSCLSIVLHHYTAWAKYHERSFDGQKFDVVKEEVGTNRNERQIESARKKARLREEAVENESLCHMDGGIFGGDT